MLKPDEVGSKCPKHEVFYETEWQEDCHKTVQFCSECRLEQYSPLARLFMEQTEGGENDRT